VLNRPLCIIHCQKMRTSMSCPQKAPVALWQGTEGGRLLYGVLTDKSWKLLKKKLSQASLQK